MTLDIGVIRERTDRLVNPRGGGSYSQLVTDTFALLDEVERLRELVRDYRENSPNVEEMSGFELKNTEWLGLDERAKEALGDE